jgi:predicted DCC family thiol-disulfide oxidoreductase YuxK
MDMNSDTVPDSRKAIVLYDGNCPLCLKSVAILKRLDWRRRLGYRNARDLANLPESAVPLNVERLLNEMHLLTPDRRRVFAGFGAFRWMASRLPLFWPVWPLLFLPGVPWLGRRIYRWVAKNRYNLVACHVGACALPARPTGLSPVNDSNAARTPSP